MRWPRFAGLVVLEILAGSACKSKPSPEPIPATAPILLEDRYEEARAEAARDGKLLFVDAWATWCHSCVAFRANVLESPALGALAPRFVFASVDTEKPASATFLQSHPMNVYPTLFVEDPRSGATLLRWEGTATVPELVRLFEAAMHPPESSAARAFAEGAQARAAGDSTHARRAFERARDEAAHDDALRALATEALVQTLYAERAWEECFQLAAHTAPLPMGTSKATLLTTSLSCAQEAATGTIPEPALAALLDQAETFVGSPASRELTVDDRSSLFQVVHALLRTRQDLERARRLATIWSSELDAAAERTDSPEHAAVYDAHRLSAYLALEHTERAVQLFEIRTGQFPRDYNAWTRLARAYLAAKQAERAEIAIGKAETLVYGPRTLQVLALKAQILDELGRREAARAVLDAALARSSELGLAASDARLVPLRNAQKAMDPSLTVGSSTRR